MMLIVFLVCLLIVLDELIIAVEGFYGSLSVGKSYGCKCVVAVTVNANIYCFALCHAYDHILLLRFVI